MTGQGVFDTLEGSCEAGAGGPQEERIELLFIPTILETEFLEIRHYRFGKAKRGRRRRGSWRRLWLRRYKWGWIG